MTARTADHPDLGCDDVFVQALRQDLPRHEDHERLRASLLAAGVAVGGAVGGAVTGLATGSVAAQVTGSAKLTGATQAATQAATVGTTGLWGKLALLPAAAKVGIGTAALAVVTTVTWGTQHGAPSRGAVKATAPIPVQSAQVLEESSPPASPKDALEPEVLVPAVAAPPEAAASPTRHRKRRSASGMAATPGTSVASDDAPASTSTLADEAALLEQSLRALAQGRTASAGRLLSLHRQRYPHGALRLERQRAEQQLHAMTVTNEPAQPEIGVHHE